MNPYLNENVGIYMISYVVPLFHDNVNVGIIGMDIDFTMVEQLAEESDAYSTALPIIDIEVAVCDFVEDIGKLADISRIISELVGGLTDAVRKNADIVL